jgi:hypothetical protein
MAMHAAFGSVRDRIAAWVTNGYLPDLAEVGDADSAR